MSAADFEQFDLLLAMDEANLAELRRRCPPQHREKVRLLMEFAPGATETEVADPYFGGAQGFEQVLDQVERACAGLLETLRAYGALTAHYSAVCEYPFKDMDT